jgi:hypothetical protein
MVCQCFFELLGILQLLIVLCCDVNLGICLYFPQVVIVVCRSRLVLAFSDSCPLDYIPVNENVSLNLVL